MYNFVKLFISLFGIGFSKIAPGTIGSFATLIFFYFFIEKISIFQFIIIFLVIFFMSIKLIEYYHDFSNKVDPSEIIIDEFLGIVFILIFYDYIKFTNNLTMFCFIFFIFRFFDIIKPFQASWIDKNIKNSWGVLLDDIVAGIYCLIILFILHEIL